VYQALRLFGISETNRVLRHFRASSCGASAVCCNTLLLADGKSNYKNQQAFLSYATRRASGASRLHTARVRAPVDSKLRAIERPAENGPQDSITSSSVGINEQRISSN
jgi:hypothetical protein